MYLTSRAMRVKYIPTQHQHCLFDSPILYGKFPFNKAPCSNPLVCGHLRTIGRALDGRDIRLQPLTAVSSQQALLLRAHIVPGLPVALWVTMLTGLVGLTISATNDPLIWGILNAFDLTPPPWWKFDRDGHIKLMASGRGRAIYSAISPACLDWWLLAAQHQRNQHNT